MAMWKTRLVSKDEIVKDTMLFRFEKPVEFIFTAGQSIDLKLINPPETDERGNIRPYSITSAPHEEYLMIATRMRDSAFKRVLRSLPEGSELEFDGPFGSFILHENIAKPAVFLIGGIGVTPIRSIILDATARKFPHQLYLFYSNRRPEDAPFLDELTKVEKENQNFTLVSTMTNVEESRLNWTGHTGYIDEELVRSKISDLELPIYYLVGPSQMVKAMRELLKKLNVSSDNIRTEEFTGY